MHFSNAFALLLWGYAALDGTLGHDVGLLLSDMLPSGAYTLGGAIPIDPARTGTPRFFLAVNHSDPLWLGSGLYALAGEGLEPVGPRWGLGGCSYWVGAAYADFNEDSFEDVVVLDGSTACEGYPSSYTPEFHRVDVLLAADEGQLLEVGASPSAGGVPKYDGPIFASDVDGDGPMDIVIALDAGSMVTEVPEGLLSTIRGLGDGTFAPAERLTQADVGVPVHTRMVHIGEYDGDEGPESSSVPPVKSPACG